MTSMKSSVLWPASFQSSVFRLFYNQTKWPRHLVHPAVTLCSTLSNWDDFFFFTNTELGGLGPTGADDCSSRLISLSIIVSTNQLVVRKSWNMSIRMTSSIVLFCPQTRDVQFPITDERNQKIFTSNQLNFETFRAHISFLRTNVCGLKLKCHLEILKILTYSGAPTKDYEGKGYFIKSINLLIVFFIKLSVDKEISESFASQSLIAKLSSVQTENVFLQH